MTSPERPEPPETGPNGLPGNLVLVGFMGTGKTSVGRRLACQLGRPFLDMDAEIEDRERRKISDIFAADGEPAFRAIESALARELGTRRGLIVSTGGGIVLDSANLGALGQTGLVVCLHASAEAILERVIGRNDRPLLEQGDKAERICSLLAERRPLYDAIPHQVLTEGKSIQDIAEEIMRLETFLKA